MSNTKIEDSIISAVEILTDRAISKAGFDKTIQATIKRCENKASGQYVVKYQDSTFYAYSTSPEVTYSKNTLVYVLVPQGDFNNNKTILGTVKKLGNDYITMLGDDAYDVVGRNLCTTQTIELCSYDIEPCNHSLSMISQEEAYRYLKDAECLQIKASVWNQLDQNQVDKAGNYYIGVKIKFLDNAEVEVVRDYRLGIPQMTGNPYTAALPTKQSFVYEIDSSNVLEILDIYVGKEGFIQDPTFSTNDIFFSAIEINAVERLEFVGDGNLSLSIISPAGKVVTGQSGDKDITLTAQVKVNGVVTTSKVEYSWFIEDCVTAAGEYYDTNAGVGWRKITDHIGPLQNILTVPAKTILAKEVRYRCIAIVDDNVLSKIIKLYNINSNYSLVIESDPTNEFYYDQGEYSLRAIFSSEDTILEPANYYWMAMDSNGIYSILSGTDVLNDHGETFKVQNIINFIRYYCIAVDNVGNTLASANITISNKMEGGGYNLVIKNGSQLFKYDEKGISPASKSNFHPIAIPTLYYQIYSPEGELTVDSEIDDKSTIVSYWMMPSEQTLLRWTEGKAPEPEDGYYKVNQQKFTYDIADRYNASKNKNDIQLIVTFHGEVLTATTSLTFTKQGGNGTNGTAYALKIYQDPRNPLILRYYIYDDEGQQMADPGEAIESNNWVINGPLEKNSIEITDNDLTALLIDHGLTTEKSADIVKLEAQAPDGHWLYAYYAVIRDNLPNLTYTLEGGAREIIFDPDLTVSSYDSTPYKVTLFNEEGNDVTNEYSLSWHADSNVFTLSKDNALRVRNNYDASTTDAVWCTVKKEDKLIGYIKIPILLLVNRYSNSALNGWDGLSININNQGKYILAPQIGAGTKNEDNTFSGIVMGTQKETSATGISTVNGLFGYGHGELKFSVNAETGRLFAKDADIDGKITAHEGAIGEWTIDVEGYLRSRNKSIWLHPTGIQTTVNEGSGRFVFYANGNFGVTTGGDVYFINGRVGPWSVDKDGLSNGSSAWIRPNTIACGAAGATLIKLEGRSSEGDHDGYIWVTPNNSDGGVRITTESIYRFVEDGTEHVVWHNEFEDLVKGLQNAGISW